LIRTVEFGRLDPVATAPGSELVDLPVDGLGNETQIQNRER